MDLMKKISKELLIKHNGNLFRVLNEYQTLIKAKDFNITKNVIEEENVTEGNPNVDDLFTEKDIEEKVTE